MSSSPQGLQAFFAPRSIAVLGASERATSSGGAVLQNLRIGGYRGQVFPINPKGGTAFGYEVKTSVAALAAPADLVVVVIRPDLILEAVTEAAACGHRHFLILPGGFVEAGPEGQKRDQALRALAAQYDLTIAGPNCAGIIHMGSETLSAGGHFGATFLRDFPPGGGIALISQSGALAEEVIAAAHAQNLKIGTVVSVGNGMQLGIADYLAYLGTRPECKAVLLYVEHIADADRFRATARQVAAVKPVVLLMGGASRDGAAAAAAHTGATARDDAAMERFAADCGLLRVKSLRRLLLAAKGFGFFPQGLGPRALILSNSGGPGVLTADQAAVENLSLPSLPAAMQAALRAGLPPEASAANPIDLLADAREERFALTLDSVETQGRGTFDVILGIHVVPFMVEAGPVVDVIAAAAAQHKHPMLHAMMGTLPDKENWFARLEAAGIPAFNDAEQMAECAGILARYPLLRERLK